MNQRDKSLPIEDVQALPDTRRLAEGSAQRIRQRMFFRLPFSMPLHADDNRVSSS